MNKLLSGLMATALVGSFAIASVMPATAAPVYVPKSEQVRTDRTDIEKVNHTRRHWRMQRRAERRWARRHAWRDRYSYGNDGYYAYRPRYYHRYYGGDYYPRYYGHRRSGVSLYLNF